MADSYLQDSHVFIHQVFCSSAPCRQRPLVQLRELVRKEPPAPGGQTLSPGTDYLLGAVAWETPPASSVKWVSRGTTSQGEAGWCKQSRRAEGHMHWWALR